MNPKYDRTVLPVRFLANALGVSNDNIEWFGDEGRVLLAQPGRPRVELFVGKKYMLIDGVKTTVFGEGANAKMGIAPLIKAYLIVLMVGVVRFYLLVSWRTH